MFESHSSGSLLYGNVTSEPVNDLPDSIMEQATPQGGTVFRV